MYQCFKMKRLIPDVIANKEESGIIILTGISRKYIILDA